MTGPTLIDRIRALSLAEGNEQLPEIESLTYEWRGHGDGSGYEVFDIVFREGGGFHYGGVYHPDDCCEGNPCRYCGAARHEAKVVPLESYGGSD